MKGVMPTIYGKYNKIRKSHPREQGKIIKRNKDLWFPNKQVVDFQTEQFYDAIFNGTKKKLKKIHRKSYNE